MKNALVWPPIDTSEYGGTDSAVAYFSWFFGEEFDKITLPVKSDSSCVEKIPYSFGTLLNMGKLNIIRTSEISIESYTHVLFTTKEPHGLPENIKCKKMTGSEKVNIPESNITHATQYYYIGTPSTEGRDAYLCVTFPYWLNGGSDESFMRHSQSLLIQQKKRMKKNQAVSVFGTGPSLGEVVSNNHALDASIICNSIVKNKSFCASLDIFAIVASDCHFHFSCNQYSYQFLSDLVHQMMLTEAIFITFDKFCPFIKNRIPEPLRTRICGIPAGRDHFGFNLDSEFRLLPGESVVNMFLLPIACFLSSKVRLCGFTGRAPNDEYFWSHADAFQYQDLLPTVRLTHPGFFSERDYDAYAKMVGEQLSERVKIARDAGIEVCSLTTSFYKGLEHNATTK